MLNDTDTSCAPPAAVWSMSHTEPKTARDRLIVAASELFCHKGFAATGIDTVIDHAGTAKATLYKHFHSKTELIEAVLTAEGEAWRKWFFGQLREIKGGPQDRLLGMFDVLETWFSHPDFYGCPFINAVGEFDTEDQVFRRVADHHKDFLRTWIRAIAIEMGAQDPQEFTRAIVVQIDGAIVAAQHARDPSFAQSAKSVVALLLDQEVRRAA